VLEGATRHHLPSSTFVVPPSPIIKHRQHSSNLPFPSTSLILDVFCIVPEHHPQPMLPSRPERGNARHNQPAPQRLELTMPPPVTPTSSSHGLSLNTSTVSDHSKWPDRPSVSPITPTSTPADLQVEDHRQNQPSASAEVTEDNLAPQPLRLDENSDAIALRNAISILQIQRQQSIKDIQSLERLKQAALHDPQGFLADLKNNKLAQPSRPGVDVDDEDSADEDGGSELANRSKFGTIPKAQNVVRCPPVNWDKYHIVGESLDRLHEQQRRYPGVTEEQIQCSGHPPKHEIAAPYRPGIDRLDEKVTVSPAKAP
jgi:hypothetical protein